MDLLNIREEHGDLGSLPNGMHAVGPGRSGRRGLLPGAIFALRNRNDGVNINQQNRLHPYYLVYVAPEGQVDRQSHRAKRLLDLARAACKEERGSFRRSIQPFNKATKDGRKMDAYSSLLRTAIRSMIELKEEKGHRQPLLRRQDQCPAQHHQRPR